MSIEPIVFEDGLKIDSTPYSFHKKIDKVRNFFIIREGCLALLVQRANFFIIYYPYLTPEELKKISKEEANEIKSRNKTPSLTKLPPLDKDIDEFKMADIDCSGNLWVLNKNNELFHFINPTTYKKSKMKNIVFNSDSSETKWTNLYLDCNISENTKITVTITCNDKSEQYINSSNIYLYDFVGKKLNVKLTLETTNNKFTPTIYSINVVTNRVSYIDFLPTYYKQMDELSFENLSRFLAIFQEIMLTFENDITKSHELLYPSLCDSDYLTWLSNLLGLSRDYRWEEEKWRKFLEKVPSLYKRLGTKSAMEDAIELYCGEIPIISDIAGKPFDFCVKLGSEHTEKEEDKEVLETIIWAFKPAYTVGHLFVDYNLDQNKDYIVGKSVLPYHTQIK